MKIIHGAAGRRDLAFSFSFLNSVADAGHKRGGGDRAFGALLRGFARGGRFGLGLILYNWFLFVRHGCDRRFGLNRMVFFSFALSGEIASLLIGGKSLSGGGGFSA